MSLRNALATACPVEEHVTIDVEGTDVHGMLRLPDEAARPCPCVLVAHGFTGSRNTDSRLLVWVSRALGHRGIGSLAIDFRGSGESEGDFCDMTPHTEITDARRALDRMETDPRVDGTRLGMVGASLGGMVAACVSGLDERVRAAVLWCAVGDSARFAEKVPDRGEDPPETERDIGGLAVGAEFYRMAVKIEIQATFAKRDCPVLIAHGTEDQTVPFDHAKRFEATARDQGREHRLLALEGAGHSFRSIPWREALIGETVDWFAAHLGAGKAR